MIPMPFTCPACGGLKTIPTPITQTWWERLTGRPSLAMERCSSCNGYGLVKGTPEQEDEQQLQAKNVTTARHQCLLEAFNHESNVFKQEQQKWLAGRNGLAILAEKVLANQITGGEWAVLQALKAARGDAFCQLSQVLKKYNPRIVPDINLLSFCVTDDGTLAKYEVGRMREPFEGSVVSACVRLVYYLGPPHHLCALEHAVDVITFDVTDGRNGSPKALSEPQIKALEKANISYKGHKLFFFDFQFSEGKTSWKTPRGPQTGEEWRFL